MKAVSILGSFIVRGLHSLTQEKKKQTRKWIMMGFFFYHFNKLLRGTSVIHSTSSPTPSSLQIHVFHTDWYNVWRMRLQRDSEICKDPCASPEYVKIVNKNMVISTPAHLI